MTDKIEQTIEEVEQRHTLQIIRANTLIENLETQRNTAHNQLAEANTNLAMAQQHIEALKAALAELQAVVDDRLQAKKDVKKAAKKK